MWQLARILRGRDSDCEDLTLYVRVEPPTVHNGKTYYLTHLVGRSRFGYKTNLILSDEVELLSIFALDVYQETYETWSSRGGCGCGIISDPKVHETPSSPSLRKSQVEQS